MAGIERRAQAAWDGDLRTGRGFLSTASGVLNNEPYSFGTRFENAPGTNPEELIGAAHAGCYSMALAGTLRSHGYAPERIETKATVTLTRQPEHGFRITKVRLEVRARVAGANQAELQELSQK
ncbi:MAG: OsmC family peroxiredoxin, partial [Anaerolineae bacterium]|nr:OsmC family peroxiredoxin [Anaerolineae bacterium]